MARQFKFGTSATKTYKTAENAKKAFTSIYTDDPNVRFMIVELGDHNCQDEKNFGRFIPVGLGQSCLEQGVHFNFHVIA